jgi:hypothetical protein
VGSNFGSYLPPAPSRRMRTGGPQHHILVSYALTARARLGSDVVPLFGLILHRCALRELARKTISSLHDAWQGRSRDDRRAQTRDRGSRLADDFGPALRRNGSDANSGKSTKSVRNRSKKTMQLVCARVRARHGVLLVEPGHDDGVGPDVAKPAQGPAPLRSQDAGRRLLPGQSGARQDALPLPRWQVDRPKDGGGSCTYRRGPATPVARLSREGSGGQKWQRNRI